MVGNVIVQCELLLISIYPWRPFRNLVASLKKSLAHPHVARNVMLNFLNPPKN